jgi:hypothetical protein
MTTKAARVLWIDDNGDREQDAKNLRDRGLRVEFRWQNLEALTPSELAGYDLLLVDYRFDSGPGQGKPFRGPAVVGLLRSVDDDTPAYLVTSESAAGRAKFSGLTWFEEYLSLDEIQDIRPARARLKEDVAGYRAIRAVRRETSADRAIRRLLRVPESSQDQLLEAVPVSVKAALTRGVDASVASGAPEVSGRLGFARWVRRVLLEKPGPLLPALHAATRVGMKEQRFRRTRAFTAATYRGIFAKSHEPRWWTAVLDDIVFSRQRQSGIAPGLPWEVGPRLFGVKARDRPSCIVCGDGGPETVARDADNGREAPVHQRHCSPDPERDFTPFFAEERVYSSGN